MEKIRILIVDDHLVVREGLKGMLISQPDFDVVGEASDGAAAVAQVLQLQPDVVLMDLRMPGTDGVSAIKSLQALNVKSRILVLTTYDTDADIVAAIAAGATGYLLKDTPRAELYRAVRAAAQGESVLAPAVASRMMAQLRGPARDSLTGREIEVLQQVARGASNKETARRLHISEATVKTHLIHIYAKLDVNDRTSAVTVALEKGIIRLDG
jgi:DNA-binding NarL/FixJ family response regulator